MILGLDASSSCIGYCMLTNDGKYDNVGFIDLKKYNSLYEKAEEFKKFLLLLPLGDLKIFIEAPLSRSNNVNVVNLLQRWNGIVCILIKEYCNCVPELIEHYTARKTLGIKIPKGTKGKETKQYLFEYVKSLNIIPEDRWQYKRTGIPKDWCYDIVDAFIISKSSFLIGKTA